MNLFFYPDDLKSKFKFQVFPSHQNRKTKLSICFWEKLRLDNFASRSTNHNWNPDHGQTKETKAATI